MTKQVELPKKLKNWNWEAIAEITDENPQKVIAEIIAQAQQEAVKRERVQLLEDFVKYCDKQHLRSSQNNNSKKTGYEDVIIWMAEHFIQALQKEGENIDAV